MAANCLFFSFLFLSFFHLTDKNIFCAHTKTFFFISLPLHTFPNVYTHLSFTIHHPYTDKISPQLTQEKVVGFTHLAVTIYFTFQNIALSISSLISSAFWQHSPSFISFLVLYMFNCPVLWGQVKTSCCLDGRKQCPQLQLHARCYTEKFHCVSFWKVSFKKTNMAQFKKIFCVETKLLVSYTISTFDDLLLF